MNESCSELAPIERRIEVEGQKFKVVHNDTPDNSLRRALSRAITGSESNFRTMRDEILLELMENWMVYSVEMGEECGYNIVDLSSQANPEEFLAKYKKYYFTTYYECPMFHLQAAANKFGFNFVIFDANDYNNGKVTVNNSKSEWLWTSKPSLVYHFLRKGSLRENWTYEFIIPIGGYETR
jgi:hypothetical protein